MNIKVLTTINLATKKLIADEQKASAKALRDTVVDIAKDAIKGSPVLTGNNRRSIKYEAKGQAGAVFSTSGYGGSLENGTYKMPARPYFKPALDKNMPKLPGMIKSYLEVISER